MKKIKNGQARILYPAKAKLSYKIPKAKYRHSQINKENSLLANLPQKVSKGYHAEWKEITSEVTWKWRKK